MWFFGEYKKWFLKSTLPDKTQKANLNKFPWDPVGTLGVNPLGKPLINAQGYIGQLIHILEVEWVIADCIMDLIKHF